MKTLEIVGGPNGSGKTTFAEIILGKRKSSLYVNSDSIARGFTINGNEYAMFEAGRIMLEIIKRYLKEGRSFGFETTMSGKIWSSYIHQAKQQGYRIVMYFVYVNSIALSFKRIQTRVKYGGHFVDKKIVKRRFKKTFSNFIKLYAPLADEWHIIDNSNNPVEIAYKTQNIEKILHPKKFQKYFT
jgi:predicted ABC-type ATPase